MARVGLEQDLLQSLTDATPSFEIHGDEYTYSYSEMTQITVGDLEQNCICIEFLSRRCGKNMKEVTNKLVQCINKMFNTDLYLICGTYTNTRGIILYVNLKNIPLDTVVVNAENVKPQPAKIKSTSAADESYNELKLKLRDNAIFERVRNFLWYSSKPFSYPDFLWNESSLSLRIRIGLDGFNMDEHALKDLYVDFCSEFGFTREQIDKDFSLRWKNKALDDIIRLNRDFEAAKYDKFRNFIDAEIKTLENTIMYT